MDFDHFTKIDLQEILIYGGYSMNKDWSEKNKRMQSLLNKEDTFKDAITGLVELRRS